VYGARDPNKDPNFLHEIEEENMIRVGVIGYGYWGPNIVRNLHGLESTRVEMVCDSNPKALARVRKAYPAIRTTSDANELLRSPDVDAVAVITPVWTHLPRRHSKMASTSSSKNHLPPVRNKRKSLSKWQSART
jgi:hypothetical protein